MKLSTTETYYCGILWQKAEKWLEQKWYDAPWRSTLHLESVCEDTQAHCLCHPEKDSRRRHTTSPKGALNFFYLFQNEDWKAFWYPTI